MKFRLIFFAAAIAVPLAAPVSDRAQQQSNPAANPAATSLEYVNKTYGFRFTLPKNWKGYSIIDSKWRGGILSGPNANQIETGPVLSIRHPLWTEKTPRQDIPIMIFTLDQWKLIEQDNLSVSAAPIGPSELGRNAKYVFALPARYNFAYLPGYEEVEKIIQSKALHPF
jgi:hypothetical protein